jgi:zinc and cadmium transporter
MSLITVILVTLLAGIGSVWVADQLVVRAQAIRRNDRYLQQGLLSLAAGALLATALLHLLPEAFESRADAHGLFVTLLVGLVLFFLLSKAQLWHHGHEHTQHGHNHRDAGWVLLVGDGIHCFGDGVLIASAFIADTHLGFIAAVSVLVHEIPHHMGDLVVLRQNAPRNAAVRKVSMAGAMTALGGAAGYGLLDQLSSWQPMLLTLAGSSFIYVALSDLVPQLHQRRTTLDTSFQVACLLLGIGGVALASAFSHVGHVH